MRKKRRGAFEEKGASVDGVNVRIVKWYDNRAVQLASSCCGVQPLSSVERWDRSKKQRVSINCPAIVDLYNNSMGRVDAVDALISYYRIHIKSKKYYLQFFFHLVDLCVVNAWLLYRRDYQSFDVPQNRQKGLLAFRVSIADALYKHNKYLLPVLREQSSKKQRRNTLGGAQTSLTRSRSPRAPHPYEESRKDGCGHWPVVEAKRQRCKNINCPGKPVFKCSKCKVHLCLNSKVNCFLEYHKQTLKSRLFASCIHVFFVLIA